MKRHLKNSDHSQEKRSRMLTPIPEECELIITYDVNQNNLNVLRDRATQTRDPQLQFELGDFYENNSVNNNNNIKYNNPAMYWYREAAKQGHACACEALTRIENLEEIERFNLGRKSLKSSCNVMGGKKTAKRRHKRRRKTSTRRRR